MNSKKFCKHFTLHNIDHHKLIIYWFNGIKTLLLRMLMQFNNPKCINFIMQVKVAWIKFIKKAIENCIWILKVLNFSR